MNDGTKSQDWVVPAILVSMVVIIAIVAAIVAGVGTSSSDDSSMAGQLESWTRCLRGEGAQVPLIESQPEGGIRITIDGDAIEGDIDPEILGRALVTCEDDAPDRVRELVRSLDRLRLGRWFGYALHDA
jgi:hypothetical protein